jgi:hypothetical protein
MSSGSALVAVSCIALAGCAVAQQMLAASDDFADYRAFRMAAPEGLRLARAQAYLEHHPRGTWATEVRSLFEAEEETWFEAAKASRTRARDYVADLPHGPHVEAARALLIVFEKEETDIDTLVLLADSRRTSAMLDVESIRRRQVSEVILEELSVLIDPAMWGSTLDDPPRALASVLRGPPERTWGTGPSPPRPTGRREDRLFFVLRTPGETEARVAQVRLRLSLQRGRIVGGIIDGEDLFVRWAEANQMRVLDPTLAAERAVAANDVAEVLAGALEARLPASRCTVQGPPSKDEILARACDGWRVSARMGARPGDDDLIAVQGPPWKG